jgi:hypothetical protein
VWTSFWIRSEEIRSSDRFVLKPGGILISSVAPVPEAMQKSYGIRSAYFYADVTTARLNKLTELFDGRKLVTEVCTAPSLEDARVAHEMLADRQRRRGKIVLSVDSRSVERFECPVLEGSSDEKNERLRFRSLSSGAIPRPYAR